MKKNTLFLLILSLLLPVGSLFAQRQMEKLNRGLVAIRTSTSSVFLSWRVLGSDPDNVAFNLYRDGVKITATPISTSSNYTDATSTGTTYTVKPVLNGVETGETNSASIWANNYFDVKLDDEKVVHDRQDAVGSVVQFVGGDVAREVGQDAIEVIFRHTVSRSFSPPLPPSSGQWRMGRIRGGRATSARTPTDTAGRPRPPTAPPRRRRGECSGCWRGPGPTGRR